MKKICFNLMMLVSLSASAKQMNGGDQSWKKDYRAEATKINDLVNTRLDVKFDYSKSWMYGKAWLTLHPQFYPTDSLKLDAKGMAIKEISMVKNGKDIPLKYRYDSLNLFITLDRTYKGGENYTIYIDYISRPDEYENASYHHGGSLAINDDKGLYFINPLGEEKDKPTQIWTQGETESNSVWMPTIDKPNQKSTQEISMTVPDKYVTLSNGLMISSKKNTDGTRTDTWKLDLPFAPYLFFMGVGDYAIVKDSYEGKDVNYYVEKPYASVARKIFGLTPEMIGFYSKVLGVDYPWPKYDQMTARDYVSGAMENVSATLHTDALQQNERQLTDENNYEDYVAHELFHQWFGDLVTCESWSNITVNESFADFSEQLWFEHKWGKDRGDEHGFEGLQKYLQGGGYNKDLVRFYYRDKEDVFDAVSYEKGGRILNMLRNYLGDSAFFKSLNLYLTTNKFKTGEAQQLRLAFEAVTGQDLNWYWNQWYYGSGNPVLNISYVYDDAAGKASVIVEQKQTGDKIFKLPFAIDIYNVANKTRYKVWAQNKIDTFTFNYTKHPDLINVDGDKILLCEKTDNKTADNYIAQIKYAPLYLDRREALTYFAKKHMKELAAGLNDKYAGLRSFTLDKLKTDSSLWNADILKTVETIANTEPDRKTKAKAIELLSATKDPKYKALFAKYVSDSSYSVSGAALEGLNNLDPVNAYALAKKYNSDAKGKLEDVISNVIADNGSESDFDFIAGNYEDEPVSREKMQTATPTFCNYLSKLNDINKIKKGVDLVIAFKNEMPSTYKNFTDPVFKTCLTKISNAKGGEVADYINNALK
jgi:aminopeptidase N